VPQAFCSSGSCAASVTMPLQAGGIGVAGPGGLSSPAAPASHKPRVNVAMMSLFISHFLGGTREDRKAPIRNPISPVANVTNPRFLKSEAVNGFSPLIRQNSTTTSPVQIAATAAPSSKPRLRLTVILPAHNDPNQGPGAGEVESETKSRWVSCGATPV